MSLQQNSQIAPPSPTDGMLHDFAQIIQDNFIVLFQAAHTHKIITSLPTTRDGNSGDIYILNDGTNTFTLVKIGTTWYKSDAYTQI